MFFSKVLHLSGGTVKGRIASDSHAPVYGKLSRLFICIFYIIMQKGKKVQFSNGFLRCCDWI